jgi:DNA-binding transcriptional ArsR family regulator
MKELVKVMKALADPGRIKIVKMLEARELCVCEIHAAPDLAQPTISKHLRILEEAGLVDRRKDGQAQGWPVRDLFFALVCAGLPVPACFVRGSGLGGPKS